jgi:hypothetical protein
MATAVCWSSSTPVSESPDDGRAQIVQVGQQPLPPGQFVAAAQAPAHLSREGSEVPGVAAPPPVGMAVFVEPFPAVLAQGLQQLVAGVLSRAGLGHHHGLGHQPAHRVDDVPVLDTLAGDHGARRGQGEPAGEHGQAVEDHPFGL